MDLCTHEMIDFREVHEDDMHCWGWSCESCGHLATGECHHESWCRQDFCGADPIGADPREPRASAVSGGRQRVSCGDPGDRCLVGA